MKFYQYGQTEKDYLKAADPVLGRAIDELGHINREITPDFFQALIDSIVSQQISGKAAETVYGRLESLAGEITPRTIADISEEEIQKCGMSYGKASYIKGAALAMLSGEIKPSEFALLSDEEIIKELTLLKGVGVWTAEMLLIFSLSRPDVISWHDLGIRRGMKKLYGYDELTKEIFQRHRETYSPYATVASLYLWAFSVTPQAFALSGS